MRNSPRRQAARQEWRTGQREAIQALHLAGVRLGANASLWYTDAVPATQVPPLPTTAVLAADQDLRLEIRSKQLLVDNHELVHIADRLLDAVADMLLPGDLPASARFDRMRQLSDELDAETEAALRTLRPVLRPWSKRPGFDRPASSARSSMTGA